MGHTIVKMGYLLSYSLHPHLCIHQRLTNVGVILCSVLEPRHLARYPARQSIVQAIQRPKDAGCYVPRLQSEDQHRLFTRPPSYRTSQSSWCHTPLVPTSGITGPILLSPWYREHKCISKFSEVGPSRELFCENVHYVDLPRNVE